MPWSVSWSLSYSNQPTQAIIFKLDLQGRTQKPPSMSSAEMQAEKHRVTKGHCVCFSVTAPGKTPSYRDGWMLLFSSVILLMSEPRFCFVLAYCLGGAKLSDSGNVPLNTREAKYLNIIKGQGIARELLRNNFQRWMWCSDNTYPPPGQASEVKVIPQKIHTYSLLENCVWAESTTARDQAEIMRKEMLKR